MIVLRPFKHKDWQYLDAWVSRESELIQFAGPIFSFPIDQKQVKNYLSNLDRIVFRVDKKGITIGMAEISLENNDVVKLARILIGEKSMRGKGIGTELIKKMVEYAFGKLRAKKVILNVFLWNIAAIKCYQKVGFSQSAKPIKNVRIGNEIWETIEMEIHRDSCTF